MLETNFCYSFRVHGDNKAQVWKLGAEVCLKSIDICKHTHTL